MPAHLRLAPQHLIYAAFAVYSFALGSIFPRLPEIQAAMGIEEGALGFGLTGTPIGTLVALTFAAPLIERVGSRRALLTLVPLLSLGYAIASHATTPFALFLLLLPVGLVVGSIELILNLEADRAEHLIGRRIMNRAHAFWSIGFFAAAIAGAGLAQMGVSPQAHLAAVFAFVVPGVALLLRSYAPAPPRPGSSEEPTPRFAWPTGAIMGLVVITLSAMLMEGASLDWSAIYMRETFQAPPFLSGFAVAVFAFSQATTRFFADAFVDRHSPSGVARSLFAVMAAGVLLVFSAPSPPMSLVGFAMLGIGSSAIFPLAMSAAAQRTDRPAAINVATLAQISFVVFLLGPPLLGSVAEHWGGQLGLRAGAAARRDQLPDGRSPWPERWGRRRAEEEVDRPAMSQPAIRCDASSPGFVPAVRLGAMGIPLPKAISSADHRWPARGRQGRLCPAPVARHEPARASFDGMQVGQDAGQD